MNRKDPKEVLLWLQQRPSLADLRTAFPAEWERIEAELARALSEQNPSRLHRLLHPAMPSLPTHRRNTLSKVEKQGIMQAAITQRMAALALEHYTLTLASIQLKGRWRFNLYNGLVAQHLLFKRGFERKPVSLFWFRLLWPLLWQRKRLMPLVERKGIYCFYSRALIHALAKLIGQRPCLEIGAGDGTLTRFLQQAGVSVTATDDYSWQDKITYPPSVLRLDAVSRAYASKHADEI